MQLPFPYFYSVVEIGSHASSVFGLFPIPSNETIWNSEWSITITRRVSLRRRPARWPVGGAVTDSVWVNPPRATGAGCAAAVCDSRPGAAAPSAGSAGSAAALYHDSSSPPRCCALCADGTPRCLCSGRASVPSAAGWRPGGAAEETEKNPSRRFAVTENRQDKQAQR